jgi:heterodisulfide reductase subunit C
VERLGKHSIVSFLADPEASDYDVWLCASCWRCQEVCPAGVDIHALMMQLRRQGPAPERYRQAYDNVLACGYALYVGPEVNLMRAAWGLAPVELASPECARLLLREAELQTQGHVGGLWSENSETI